MDKKIPMYLAVQLESDCITHGKRVWIPLPATKKQFQTACEEAAGICGADVIIKRYGVRVPGMYQSMCMEAPLGQLNHLASRLQTLNDEQITKLCAIIESDYYFTSVEQLIDYTYDPDRYNLAADVKCECDLAKMILFDSSKCRVPDEWIPCIDMEYFGSKMAQQERGVFTSLGYLTSRGGWSDTAARRKVPAALDLKGSFGEDLYGELDYSED